MRARGRERDRQRERDRKKGRDREGGQGGREDLESNNLEPKCKETCIAFDLLFLICANSLGIGMLVM